MEEFGLTAHVRTRGEAANAIKEATGFKAHRWVVVRTHGSLNRYRRILVRIGTNRWRVASPVFISPVLSSPPRRQIILIGFWPKKAQVDSIPGTTSL